MDWMYWNSFAEFIAMGTHGVYVWGSFIVMAVAMVAEPLLIVKGHRQLLARLRRQFRAEKSERGRATVRQTQNRLGVPSTPGTPSNSESKA
ncbi:heme exporter protein CcmD [Propionivibrio soli]|uniref:heme exporter protein CcmD n=1 Tax=Propionivibrio soli TaxID=2976531 RepID=UPI0021E790E4